MSLITITEQTARRYILGRQGLWPGRRWRGKEGAGEAILRVEKVQVDTVAAVARNHELVLWSRVADYRSSHLDELFYKERRLFDWGGILFIYPIEDIALFRTIMLGRRSRNHWAAHIATFGEAMEFVRRELRQRGPLGNRDFEGGKRIVGAYRSQKETGQATYAMWQLGELMTHSRRGSDRVYDFTDNILGTSLYGPMPPLSPDPIHIPEEEITSVEKHLALKTVRHLALSTFRGRSFTPVCRKESVAWSRTLLNSLVEEGSVTQVHVEGLKEVHYMPTADLSLLEILEQGNVPQEWQPLETTTLEEVNLLAPLDNAIVDRLRLNSLFSFDYIWEVYKPVHLRKYGYYTMPILYGDRLVGRLNPKLDRKSKTLYIDGFWLEDEALAEDTQFASALSAGLSRFARFHGAERLDLSSLEPALLGGIKIST